MDADFPPDDATGLDEALDEGLDEEDDSYVDRRFAGRAATIDEATETQRSSWHRVPGARVSPEEGSVLEFPVERVDSEASEVEQLGTKTKYWVRRPDGSRYLFKAEEKGTGEDWAEKIACEIAATLHLPHVHYDLAHDVLHDVPGVVSDNFIRPGEMLVHGNELLMRHDPQYAGRYGSKQGVPGYTVAAVAEVLATLHPCPARFCEDLPPSIETALGTFIGYILLDALLANQDRHHENWAAIESGGKLWLSPAFDQGACLARNLTTEERHKRLTTNDRQQQIPHFAKRAKSEFMREPTDDPRASKKLKTREAWSAFAALDPAAAGVWLQQLTALDEGRVRLLISMVPPHRMNRTTREFTTRLIFENRRWLLEEGNPQSSPG